MRICGMGSATHQLRAIPSVDRLLGDLDGVVPRPLVVRAVRELLREVRESGDVPGYEVLLEQAQNAIHALSRARLQPVINGTGISLHTNLGRSPLSTGAVDAMAAVAGGYSNLELDLANGKRGRRGAYLEQCFSVLTGSEAALVVNNCAAALWLVLNQLIRGERSEVLISRGELVQIGGGFRIPDILESSGARLREVGTTNRTTFEDYERALSERTALILVVHRSNFFMEGFVASPDLSALSKLAKKWGIPLVYDQGSGAMVGTEGIPGVGHEVTVAESLEQGASLTCFSGDKLLGGPQAGIICGRRELVAALRRNPLCRALRCDKLVLSALQATVESYLIASTGAGKLSAEGMSATVPLFQALDVAPDELNRRAEAICVALQDTDWRVDRIETENEVGGGTLPQSRVPSVALAFRWPSCRVEDLAKRFREGTPPLVGYVEEDAFVVDLRTVFESQDRDIVDHFQRFAAAWEA